MLRAFAKWALRHGASFAPAAQTEQKRPITKPILQLNSEARYFAVTPERSGPFPAGNGGGAPLPSARGTQELRGRSRHSAARSRNGGRATSMLLGGEKNIKNKKVRHGLTTTPTGRPAGPQRGSDPSIAALPAPLRGLPSPFLPAGPRGGCGARGPPGARAGTAAPRRGGRSGERRRRRRRKAAHTRPRAPRPR